MKLYSSLISIVIVVLSSLCISGNVLGRSRTDEKIVNGSPAPEEYCKRIVLVTTTPGEQYCAGSIVSNSWILTAAHCCGEDASKYTVTAGAYNLGNKTEASMYWQNRTVTKLWAHPNYKINSTYDCCLMLLNESLVYNERATATPLAENWNPLPEPDPHTLMGWGTTSSMGGVSDTLLFAIASYVNYTICNDMNMGYHGAVDEVSEYCCNGRCSMVTMECADTCQGDSGGSATVSRNGKPCQVGIVSWGNFCGIKNYPGVYAKVPSCMSWIKQTMQDQNATMPQTCSM